MPLRIENVADGCGPVCRERTKTYEELKKDKEAKGESVKPMKQPRGENNDAKDKMQKEKPMEKPKKDKPRKKYFKPPGPGKTAKDEQIEMTPDEIIAHLEKENEKHEKMFREFSKVPQKV